MDEEEKKPSVIKKLFKAIAIAIIAGVYLVLMIRMFVSCDSPLTKKILKNDAIIAAYEEDPQGFEIQKYSFSDYYRNVDEGKLLMLDNLYYLVPTRDLQISVKYNTKIVDNTDGSIPFAFYLEDEKGNRYSDYFYEYEERYGFGYIRLDFRGIDLIDPEGGVDENGEPVRKNYEMYLLKKNADGSTSDYESFSIYLGDPNYRKIFYK